MEQILATLTSVTLNSILPSLITLALGIVVIKSVMKLLDRAIERTRLEKAAVSLLRSLLKVVLYVLLGLMVASGLGIDVSGVLALTSVVSLVVSLSLQDALSNVVGGFTLLSTRPFKAGDYVEIGGQGGTVLSIDITYTTLASPDNKTISIPNSTVVSSQIVNYATSGSRRVDIAVSASHDSPIEDVKRALLAAADLDFVQTDPAPFVGVDKFGESAVQYVLRVWTATDRYWDAYFQINENIPAQFKKAGVRMTYPHLNVHMDT